MVMHPQWCSYGHPTTRTNPPIGAVPLRAVPDTMRYAIGSGFLCSENQRITEMKKEIIRAIINAVIAILTAIGTSLTVVSM